MSDISKALVKLSRHCWDTRELLCIPLPTVRFLFPVNILSAKRRRDEIGLEDVDHKSDRARSLKPQVDEKTTVKTRE